MKANHTQRLRIFSILGLRLLLILLLSLPRRLVSLSHHGYRVGTHQTAQ
jgi:hypothetical protein